jgi:hypothetical protein
MLAALANGEEEQLARNRVLAVYPETTRGYLEGIKDFAGQYVQAMRGAIEFGDIQANSSMRKRSLASGQSRRLVSSRRD